MIDLRNIEQYRENNRIEAKKALGGLPHSIWETYSAFANTLGGVILLGVEEYRDKTLHPVDLPDPEGLAEEFWAQLNDPQRCSVNILTEKNVRIEAVGGCRIVVIEVPRAQRYDRPVYVGGDPLTGTYCRSGEGDYHCSDEALWAMYRDADRRTRDMRLLPGLELSALRRDTVAAFRRRMGRSRPGHVWESLDDTAFLLQLGAVGKDESGQVHPTAAGLLLFGRARDILSKFPCYRLEYREEGVCRLLSGGEGWSGNVCDFFFRVYHRLHLHPERFGPGGCRAPVRGALREALANCLVNADYDGRQGVLVSRESRRITMTNPGDFRIGVEEARVGGRSDPRNGAMSRMFRCIDIGEGVGGGIPGLFYVWRQQGWGEPTITQNFAPNRVTLTLPLTPRAGRRQRADGQSALLRAAAQKEMVVDYLTEHAAASAAELCQLLSLRPALVRKLLRQLTEEDAVSHTATEKGVIWRLKA